MAQYHGLSNRIGGLQTEVTDLQEGGATREPNDIPDLKP